MNFNIVHTLNQFNLEFEGKLKTPSCLPACLEEMCAGWTIEALQQMLSRLTMKNSTTVPLFFQKPEELSAFSNKQYALNEVFKLFDTQHLGRIDSFELLIAVCMITTGSLQKKLETSFNIISISDEGKLSKDGFCFFLDSYIRGISKSILKKTDTFYPRNPNFRLSSKEIDLICHSVFKTQNEKISAADFCVYISHENSSLKTLFTLYPQTLQSSQEFYRDLMRNRLKTVLYIKTFLNKIILDILK